VATVVCALWLDAFAASYVHVLKNAVSSTLKRKHRFICVSDNPEYLGGDIETVRLPDMGIPLVHKKTGGWPKLAIFKPGLLPPDEPTLYLDLDVLLLADLDAYFDQIEADPQVFNALREWNPTLWELLPTSLRPDRGVQGSVLGFYPKEQAYIYEIFMNGREEHYKVYRNEQRFLTAAARRRQYWPFPWTASFKWHCLKYCPLNYVFPEIRKPRNAKIVAFHGNPRPIDVVPKGHYRWGTSRKFGYGTVDWVRDYWIRNDTTSGSLAGD
jgi:hypothetical protein